MPPKKIIDRARIARAAFEIMRSEGLDAIDARRVARALGSSTHPIFDAYRSMDEVKSDAIKLAWEYYGETIRSAAHGDMPYLATGKAYLAFSTDEPQLFRDLFLTVREGENTQDTLDRDPTTRFLHELVAAQAGVAPDRAALIQFEMWTVVHGLAAMIATKVFTPTPELIDTVLIDVFRSLRDRAKKQPL